MTLYTESRFLCQVLQMENNWFIMMALKMKTITRGLAPIFLSAVLLVPASSDQPKGPAGVPVERSFFHLTLGMTMEDFSKRYESQERTDPFYNLAQGERLFEVKAGSLPKEVSALVAKFLNNRLYRISAEYTKEFAEQTSWEALLTKMAKKYGEVTVQANAEGEKRIEIARWDDGTTTLLLQRETKMKLESKKFKAAYTFSILYLDDAIWNERLAMEQQLF